MSEKKIQLDFDEVNDPIDTSHSTNCDHYFNDNHNQDQEGNIFISVIIALVITFFLIGIEVPFIKESIEENFSFNIYRSSNDYQIAILIALIVINFGVSLRMLIRTTEPRKSNETVYLESENNLQNQESNNSNNERKIPGVNEYGVDQTVFDFTSYRCYVIRPHK